MIVLSTHCDYQIIKDVWFVTECDALITPLSSPVSLFNYLMISRQSVIEDSFYILMVYSYGHALALMFINIQVVT